jgi:hypothetical protein
MAPVPRVKSLKREDYKQAPEWFDALLLTLNQNLGDVSQALSNGLTQAENGRAEFKTIELTMPLEYPPWRVVGGAGNPAFQNNFSSWGAPWTLGRFRMLPDGYVEIGGLIRMPTPAIASGIIFTLPAGYRANEWHRFSQLCGSGTAGTPSGLNVNVYDTGQVAAGEGNPTADQWINLDGIRFQVKGALAARVEAFPAPFPLAVRLVNKWPVKTMQVVSVFDVTGQQPGTVGPVSATWNTREAGVVAVEALWGLQPGRSYRVTLLVTAG